MIIAKLFPHLNFSQYNKPKFNDRYLDDLANATCAVLSGGCSGSMFNPTYAAVFTFHQVKDKQGNVSVDFDYGGK